MAGEDGHDHVNDLALVAKISHVLLSQACQRINFRWGKLQVTARRPLETPPHLLGDLRHR
jgi:hypothetical protein